MIKSIIFLGMAGVGKSTIGKLCAQQLHLKFIDTDKILIDKYHDSIQNIILKFGEKKFNEIESQLVIDSIGDFSIISPGGSFIYGSETLNSIMNDVIFIYLFDDPNNIKARIPNLYSRGIVGINEKSFETICHERHELFIKYAHIQFNLNQTGFDEVSHQAVHFIKSLM